MLTKHTTELYEPEKELARLRYLLNRKDIELDNAFSELSGQREVNSLCAAIIMYLLSKNAKTDDKGLVAKLNKITVSEFVGRYYATCEDGGDDYIIKFAERANGK